jgi:hypothetical protein
MSYNARAGHGRRGFGDGFGFLGGMPAAGEIDDVYSWHNFMDWMDGCVDYLMMAAPSMLKERSMVVETLSSA